jgi:hypothetical protein
MNSVFILFTPSFQSRLRKEIDFEVRLDFWEKCWTFWKNFSRRMFTGRGSCKTWSDSQRCVYDSHKFGWSETLSDSDLLSHKWANSPAVPQSVRPGNELFVFSRIISVWTFEFALLSVSVNGDFEKFIKKWSMFAIGQTVMKTRGEFLKEVSEKWQNTLWEKARKLKVSSIYRKQERKMWESKRGIEKLQDERNDHKK